jgi:hypothetical protein
MISTLGSFHMFSFIQIIWWSFFFGPFWTKLDPESVHSTISRIFKMIFKMFSHYFLFTIISWLLKKNWQFGHKMVPEMVRLWFSRHLKPIFAISTLEFLHIFNFIHIWQSIFLAHFGHNWTPNRYILWFLEILIMIFVIGIFCLLHVVLISWRYCNIRFWVN